VGLSRSVGRAAAFPFGRKFPSRRKFGSLEGNLEGNSIWKEIGRNIVIRREMRRKSIFSKNKAIFIQFCAEEDSENAISNDLETP
jgi:hypothetical protein